MNPSTGTFISMDVYQGTAFEPVSLHKYLYANANPIMYSDPSGYVATLGEAAVATAIIGGITSGVLQSCLSVLRSLDAGAEISGMDVAVEFIDGFFKGVIAGLAIFLLMQILPVCIVMLGLGIMAFANGAQMAVAAYDEMQQGNYRTAIGYSVLSIKSFYIGGMLINFALSSDSCFTGDTLVATEEGFRRIDEIEIGDYVWAYNTENGELELKEVLDVFIKENTEILHLTTSNGETIDTTTNHPFYVEEKGWVAAGDLKVGDAVYTIDGEEVEIAEMAVEKFVDPVTVYNLEVEDFHTYFVGESKVLVHNLYGKTNKSIKDSQNYPDNFVGRQNGKVKVNVKNMDLLRQLREVEPGKWYKVYQDGYDMWGNEISIHYFQSKSGIVFDVEVHSGWSNP